MKEKDRLFYGEYAPRLEELQSMLLGEINAILDSIIPAPEPALAEHVKSRIKGSESMKEKLARRGFEQTPESGLRELSDIIGLRVITHFVGDIYTMLEKIRNCDKWRVTAVKDYIADSKPNG